MVNCAKLKKHALISITLDAKTAHRVYTTFANKYLWIGRPLGSAKILNRIKRQFNENKLNLNDFRQAIMELQEGKF